MPATLTVTKQWHDGKVLNVIGTVVLTGSYPTGGDPLDLTGKGIQTAQKPIIARIDTRTGGFKTTYIPGTSLANGKVKVMVNDAGGANAAMGEHTAASYVAGLTGDTLDFHGIFEFSAI